MEMLASVFILVGIAALAYTMGNRYKTQKESSEKIKKEMSLQNKKNEEEHKKQFIINKVEKFLKGSKFIEPIARWREENIYRYILNNGYLYEFEDTMSENNQRIGIDEDFLCFKRLCYKRVNNPLDFLNKLDSVKDESLSA